MRRVARRLCTLCSAVSLVLCVALCVLWVRSYGVAERVSRVSRGPATVENYILLYSADGRLLVRNERTYYRDLSPDEADALRHFYPGGWGYRHGADVHGNRVWNYPHWRGFVFDSANAPIFHQWEMRNNYLIAGAPYWSLAAPLSVAPLLRLWISLRKRMARRSSRVGLCATCGYDLRASPERCPECGTCAAITGGK